MKKRFFAFLLVLVLGLSMTGCSKETAKEDENKKEELDDMDVIFEYDDASEYITIPENYIGIEVIGFQEVTDSEMREQIDLARYAHMKTEQITEGTVKEGDAVHVSSKGTLKGETSPFEMQEYDFVIGAGSMLQEYENSLIGVKVGDTVHINLTFPDDYYEEVKGKEASFEVTVEYLHGDPYVADWTDEFVQEITDGECKNTKDYEAELREELQANKNQEIYYMQQEEIVKYLVENSVVHKFPEGLVENQYDNYMEEYKRNFEENETYDEFETYILIEEGYASMDEFYAFVQECAENTATELLAYQAIAYKEGITLTKVEYDNFLQSFASSQGYTTASLFEEEFMSVYGEQDENFLYKRFLNQKVVEFLQDNAKSTAIMADDLK